MRTTALALAGVLALVAGCSKDEAKAPTCGTASPVVSAVVLAPSILNTNQIGQFEATVTDADATCGGAEPFSYEWTLVLQPAGSLAMLSSATSSRPWIRPDVPGNYSVRVVARDVTGRSSAPATLDFSASTCGSAAPVVESITTTPTGPNAGDTVALGAVVSDADTAVGCAMPDSVTYAWSLSAMPPGSYAELVGVNTQQPWFHADIPGPYEFALTVTDAAGHTGHSAKTVSVSTCGSAPPVVTGVTSTPAAPEVGQAALLAATVTDADTSGACGKVETFSYSWRALSVPAGSMAALNDVSLTTPSFVPDAPGDYSFEVAVTDSTGNVGLSTITVPVSTCGTSAPLISAIHFSPSIVNAGSTVQLTADVTDPDSACGVAEVFTYSWQLVGSPAGSLATLSDPSSSSPWFVADVPGSYLVRLLVTDAAGHRSAPSAVAVSASTCGSASPVALASVIAPTTSGPSANLVYTSPIPNYIQLSADASTDPDNACLAAPQALSYEWRFLALPLGYCGLFADGNTCDASPSTLVNPTLVGRGPGVYVIGLTVTDSTGRASEATATLTFP